MEPREKLPKVKLSDEIQKRENEILRLYLPSADTVPDITSYWICNWNETGRRI